jgi:hypothetical protein
MNKFRQLSMKAALLYFVASAAISNPATAQVYLQDYTTIHVDPDKKQWVVQDAIYRDDEQKVYYIAQQLRPMDKKESFLGITMCDADMNPIVTWEYFNESKKMIIKTENMDEMYGEKALILVGHYDDENSISEPFVMSVDKTNGAVNWFHFFPGMELTSLEAEKDYVLVTGKRALPYQDGIFSFSSSAATLMRLDNGGNLVWEREFEGYKYTNSEYGPKYSGNILNDVKRIDDKYFVAVGNTNDWVYKDNPNNLWDVDGLVVMTDADGNIAYSVFLGNSLPMDPNGQQAIQYELMDHLTFDPKDKTVVITGERLDNPQNKVSDQSPEPDQWGLWVTKFDPYSVANVWTYRYQYKDKYYRLTDPEIDYDGGKQYGISYNFDKYNTMAMKLKNDGSVAYHRYHYVSGFNNDEKVLNDITKAFEYNNMTLVGAVNPDVDRYNASYGWNIQAFDNILEKCEMENYDIKPKEVKYDIDKVKNREYKVEVKKVDIKEDKIKLVNRIICDKKQVSFKSTPVDDGTVSSVTQDLSNNVTIQVTQSTLAAKANTTFKAVLYNALGQKMLETASFEHSYKLNVGQLPAGIYYLHVSGNGFKQAHTVLVN